MHRQDRSSVLFSMAAAFILFAGNESVFANDRESPVIEGTPLAELPSEPGPHIDKIKALKAGEWLNLGAPAADEQWGRARGCAWGAEALDLAPSLRGAFRTGEGVHAYVKPDGFGQDDYWFYDINAHRWICLYPGTDTKNFNAFVEKGKIKVDDKGRAVTDKGEPVPAHLLIHDWGNSSYDTHRKQFRFLGGGGFGKYFFPGWDKVKDGISQLEEQGLGKKGAGPFAPWAYDAKTGRFERESATNGHGGVGRFSQFLYMANEKKFFLGGGKGIAYFDPATKTWEKAAVSGPRPKGYDFGGCYDSKRSHVYFGRQAMHRFDVASGSLTEIAIPESGRIGTNEGSITYDSVNDRIVVMAFRGAAKKVHAYNPETESWEAPVPFSEAFEKGMRGRNTFSVMFDAELGVHFIYLAGDSRDNGEMWVYKLSIQK